MTGELEASSFTKRLSEIGVAAAVIVYFAGWTFISELFRKFGLSPHAIDIPVYSVFVYAYDALFTTCWGWLVVTAGVIALGSLVVVKPSQTSFTIYLLLTVFTFPIVHYIAKKSAADRADEIRSGKACYASVVVRSEKTYPPAFTDDLTHDDLAVIVTTKDMVYVVRQSSATFGGMLPAGKTYILPLSDFAVSIRLKPAAKVP